MSGEKKDQTERPLELFDYNPPNTMMPQILYPSDVHPGGLSGGAFYGVTMGPLGLSAAGLEALEQHEAEKASRALGLELGPPVTLEQAKALHVQRALAECGWNLTKAADVLAISRRTLQRSVARWGIEKGAPAPAIAADSEELVTFERANQIHVKQVLDELAWHMSEAARTLGIHRRTLYRLLERWGIERPEGTTS